MRRAPPTASLGLVVCGLALLALARAEETSGDAHALSPERSRVGEGTFDASSDPGEADESPDARAIREGRPLDLNRATETDLLLLPRIGPSLAARIVAHRDAHGPFESVDELSEVRGIGPRTLELLRPLVSVAEAGERAP